MRPGRSKAGHTLTSWWRDHSQPNLFTRDDDTVLVRAATDMNVLRDLVDETRADADESKALIGGQITDRLELVRTRALDSEINLIESDLRRQCLKAAREFTPARFHQAEAAQIQASLLAVVHAVDADYPRTEQDRYDLQHVTEAVAMGLTVFVTRDEHLTSSLGPPAEKDYGLRILRPIDVIIHLDELARADAYRPAALLDTSYQQRRLGVGGAEDLAMLANVGERCWPPPTSTSPVGG